MISRNQVPVQLRSILKRFFGSLAQSTPLRSHTQNTDEVLVRSSMHIAKRIRSSFS